MHKSQHFYTYWYCLLLLSLKIVQRIAAVESKQDWICSSLGFCLLKKSPEMGDVVHFESQHDCRLSCGQFGAIWPMPTGNCSLGHGRVRFDPSKMYFHVNALSPQTLQFVRESNCIFLSNILKECIGDCTLDNGKAIVVKSIVNSNSLVLNWETDESYTLNIKTTDITTVVDIKAATVFGHRLALETLSNLITGCIRNGLLLVSVSNVEDCPIFAHRGLLLDTSRNYIPLHYILKILDGMAASKLNVFHWHVVDTHSFPLEVTRVPQMQRFGAYSSEHIYSRADTRNIIKYAKQRGIRVLIEIDGPSHAGNGWQWGPMAGLGNLSVCINKQPWRSFCKQPPCGQLNPINDNMYLVMKEIYAHLAEVIEPEETLHMGGDEVFIPCWKSTQEITNVMKQRGYGLEMDGFNKLLAEYHSRNLAAWDNVTQHQRTRNNAKLKSVIVWSSQLTDPDLIENYFPKERFVIQTWVDQAEPLNNKLIAKGYRIIASPTDAWYLDCGFWLQTRYYHWLRVYNVTMQRNAQMLGGEVCMWSEYVDQNSVESRIWPRAGAAAERLWSDPNTPALAAKMRFYRYRDRLIARGIQPDAVTPQWCVLNENECL